MPTLVFWVAFGWALASGPDSGQRSHCTEAERFLVATGLAARTDPDTLDDWRTAKRHPACRVTAAGLTTLSLADEAQRFYDRVRQDGWTRTPDPRDAPRESSLRFRKAGSDCLFNVYEGALLLTEAEREVSSARAPSAGERRYNIFVVCLPAMPAAVRSAPRTAMAGL
jgi:hypothetical protein